MFIPSVRHYSLIRTNKHPPKPWFRSGFIFGVPRPGVIIFEPRKKIEKLFYPSGGSILGGSLGTAGSPFSMRSVTL